MELLDIKSELDALRSEVAYLQGLIESGNYGETCGITESAPCTGIVGSDEEGVLLPYTVRWFSKKECYGIYLNSNCLMVSGQYVNSFGLTKFDDAGDDWWVCPVSSGRLYLNVKANYYVESLDDADHIDRSKVIHVVAEFSGTKENYNDKFCVCQSIEICNIGSNHDVHQKVAGALTLESPIPEIVRGVSEGGSGLLDILDISRNSDGCVRLSAPISIVGENGVDVKVDEEWHTYTISLSGGGTGGSGGTGGTGGSGEGDGGDSGLEFRAGDGIIFIDGDGNECDTTKGHPAPFTIKAVYV